MAGFGWNVPGGGQGRKPSYQYGTPQGNFGAPPAYGQPPAPHGYGTQPQPQPKRDYPFPELLEWTSSRLERATTDESIVDEFYNRLPQVAEKTRDVESKEAANKRLAATNVQTEKELRTSESEMERIGAIGVEALARVTALRKRRHEIEERRSRTTLSRQLNDKTESVDSRCRDSERLLLSEDGPAWESFATDFQRDRREYHRLAALAERLRETK